MKDIAIIGAGWFGLHIGKYLKEKGHTITIFEQADDILSAASGKNQYRLHLGFHYPRNYSTRIKNYQNYYRFLKDYPGLAEPVARNYYCVVNEESLLDFTTYKGIFQFDGIPYKESQLTDSFNLDKIEGCVSCDEMVLNTTSIRNHFKSIFTEKELRLNTKVKHIEHTLNGAIVNDDLFDYCINCTYNHFNHIKNLEVNYEACLTLVYRCLNKNIYDSSVTLVDGDFFSLYPIADESLCYTLTHVKYTPMQSFSKPEDCITYIENLQDSDIEKKRIEMEENVRKYYPSFNEDFLYKRHFCSIKTKTVSNSANRDLHVSVEGNILNAFSGKILEIFELEKYINTWLKLV